MGIVPDLIERLEIAPVFNISAGDIRHRLHHLCLRGQKAGSYLMGSDPRTGGGPRLIGEVPPVEISSVVNLIITAGDYTIIEIIDVV